MKKLLVVLLAFGMAGVPAYLWVVGSVLDVSRRYPLGEFATIDAWLTEKGFVKTEQPVGEGDPEPPPELAGARRFVYSHEYTERADPRPSEVWVALDVVGRVHGVVSTFSSGVEEMGAPTSRGESFIGTLWLETAGARPVFADEQRGRGRFARQYRVATFQQGRVKGTWTKAYESHVDARTIHDRVTLHVE